VIGGKKAEKEEAATTWRKENKRLASAWVGKERNMFIRRSRGGRTR